MNGKIAWVLSGGGSKGSWQAGVMKQLYDQGIRPDALYGTSVGSLNSCGYSFTGMDGVMATWNSVQGNKDVLYPNGIQWLWNFPRLFTAQGIYTTDPLRKVITDRVMNNTPTCEAVSCYVDLISGKVLYGSCLTQTKEDYIDSVIASATIPLIMAPKNYMVDGGVKKQTPLGKAIEDGADKIYVILCNPYTAGDEAADLNHKWFPWYYVLNRSVDDLMCHQIFLRDIQDALFYNKYADRFTDIGIRKVEMHVYAPDRYWMDTIDFDPVKIKAALAAGEQSVELDQDALMAVK